MYQKIKLQWYRYLQIPVLVWEDFETYTQLVFDVMSYLLCVHIENSNGN
jgi:hypothetical protein